MLHGCLSALCPPLAPLSPLPATPCPSEGADSQLTWHHRVAIAKDVASGLAFLHSENVIHRDFKSANVLLTNVRDGHGYLSSSPFCGVPHCAA